MAEREQDAVIVAPPTFLMTILNPYLSYIYFDMYLCSNTTPYLFMLVSDIGLVGLAVQSSPTTTSVRSFKGT